MVQRGPGTAILRTVEVVVVVVVDPVVVVVDRVAVGAAALRRRACRVRPTPTTVPMEFQRLPAPATGIRTALRRRGYRASSFQSIPTECKLLPESVRPGGRMFSR